MSPNPMNTLVSKLWKNDIDEAIIEVCLRIIQEPLLYFSEADVQQLLVEELHGIRKLATPYKTKVPKGEGSEGMYKTSLVHREYGAGEGQRFDVAIFDPSDVGEIIDVNLRKKEGEDLEYLQPAYAFELGTEKTGNIGEHFKNDIKKLTAGTKEGGCGYLIHLYKDSTLRPSGTKSREKTESTIEEDFKDVFKNNANDLPSNINIKVLAILLRIGRQGNWIRGKCEIFDRTNGGWPQINIGKVADIRIALRKQLK